MQVDYGGTVTLHRTYIDDTLKPDTCHSDLRHTRVIPDLLVVGRNERLLLLELPSLLLVVPLLAAVPEDLPLAGPMLQPEEG